MRFCNLCGFPRDDDAYHVQMTKGARRTCMLAFTVLNRTSGKRREADPSKEPLGLQRTKQNQAAFVHESRL